MPNKPGYFAEYYKENKDKVNSKRKKKYDNDSSYREKILKASRDYREDHRDPNRIRMPRYQKPLKIEAGDGGELVLFSVGAMAVYLDRSVQALNHWEHAGILPMTPYRDERGFRYYTTDMMAAVREVVGEKRRLFPIDPSMNKKILEAWEALGVPLKAKSWKKAIAATTTPRRSARPAAR